MNRTKAFATTALVLFLAALLVTPAGAAKRRRSVPATPEIPTSAMSQSLQVPPSVEALVAPGLTPAESLRVVAAFLELTPEQVSSLTTLLQERHQAIVPLLQEIHTRQQQIADQLQSGAPDPTVIGNLVIEIHQFLQQVYQAQATFMQGFLNLLNDEQRRRYEALRLAEQLQPLLPAFRTLRLI